MTREAKFTVTIVGNRSNTSRTVTVLGTILRDTIEDAVSEFLKVEAETDTFLTEEDLEFLNNL